MHEVACKLLAEINLSIYNVYLLQGNNIIQAGKFMLNSHSKQNTVHYLLDWEGIDWDCSSAAYNYTMIRWEEACRMYEAPLPAVTGETQTGRRQLELRSH